MAIAIPIDSGMENILNVTDIADFPFEIRLIQCGFAGNEHKIITFLSL